MKPSLEQSNPRLIGEPDSAVRKPIMHRAATALGGLSNNGKTDIGRYNI
jgi:hypothetical protein